MELSLKRLAMISVGTSYWLRVGKKSLYYWVTESVGGNPESLYWVPLKWKDGPETCQERFNDMLVVKDDFKGIGLPKKIYDELVSVIILLGEQGLEWHQELKKTVDEPLFRRIKFKCYDLSYNPYGLIDEKRVADKVIKHLEQMEGDRTLTVFHRCCGYASRSYIHRNMDNILYHYRHFFGSDSWYCPRNSPKQIDFILYSVVFFGDEQRLSLRNHPFLKEYNFEKLNCSKVAHMFSLAVSGGFEVAVEYFWRLMDQQEKKNQILSAATTCVEEYIYHGYGYYENNARRYANILVRFYMIMSEELQKKFLFINQDDFNSQAILVMFLRHWPFQELFFPAFNIINRNRDDDITWYYVLVGNILDSIDRMHAMGVDFKIVKLDQILYTVCSEIEKRLTFDTEVSYDSKCFEDFKLLALIKTERYDLLKKILQFSFKSAQERQKLVQKLNFREFVLGNNWIALVKFLNFWSMLFEEQIEFTYETDFMAICVELVVKGDIMLADDILDWSFQSAGRQVEEFDCNWLTIIWQIKWYDEIINKSPLLGKYEDSKFAPFFDALKKEIKRTLEWLLKNHFQINQIFSEKILKDFVRELVSNVNVTKMKPLTPVDITCELVNTFLERSSLLKREIQLNININDWRLIFSKREEYVNEIEKLENWIFDNQE